MVDRFTGDESAAYEALTARLTDEDVPLGAPVDAATGAEAARRGRAFLVGEYGSEEALAKVLRRGRPRVGQERPSGQSPTVRGRITDEDFAAFKALEAKTGRSQSELVRQAVHGLLVAEQLVS